MTHMKRDAEVMLDGTIDNTIVAHEWGHYWHHRLVSCGQAQCNGMSEGWGDFDSLMLVIRDGDTFDGGKTYAMAQYATGGFAKDPSYFGIRRAPYSRDIMKNPFTFGHVRQASMLPTNGAPLSPAGADMSEVHNVGEIWAETLFEAYANLIDKLKAATPPLAFEDIKRRMADYLVAGMKATPNEPTFTEQRDAILSAVLATKRMDDFTALAQGFAKRGMGVAAISPPITSTTNNEAVEDFAFKGALALVTAETKLDDSGTSCDHDGILDPNETGTLTVTVKNSGWLKLSKTQVTATSSDANLTFTAQAGEGGSDMLTLDPYESKTVKLTATAKMGIAKKSVPVTITLSDADAVKPSVDVKVDVPVNFDDIKASSKTDDVESALPPVWELTHDPKLTEDSWSRSGDAMNHFWFGAASADPSDERLESPALVVSPTEAFTLTAQHHYSFEAGTTAPMGNYDGAVIEVAEVTADGGAGEWKDVSTYVDPMYPGTIYTAAPDPDDNKLAGRKGFVGKSGGAMPGTSDVELKLDFGTKLAGKTVKVRFRIGTDSGNGTESIGWSIDNIAFTGITNSPFAKVSDNSGICTTGDGGTTDGGAKPDSGTGGAGGTGGSTGTGGTGTTDDSCSCSIPGGRSGSGTAAVGVFGALAMLLRGRRRRQQG
jgi:hypothetical protein